MSVDREREIARALLLEKRGQLDAAVKSYRDAGALEDAARVLESLGRHDDAGQLLWDSLGTDLAGIERLSPDHKKLALKAALCFAEGSNTRLGMLLLLALGERRLAAELQQRASLADSPPPPAATLGTGRTEPYPALSGPHSVVEEPPRRAPSGSHAAVDARRTPSGSHPVLEPERIPTPIASSHPRSGAVPIIEERISTQPRRMTGSHPVLATPPAGTPASPLDEARALERAGRLEDALQAYLRLGKLSWAARVARSLGRLDEAGELYLKGELFLEAAACYLDSGAHTQCMQALLRVARDNPGYRDACVHLIRLAAKLNVLDSQLEPFVAEFVGSGPLREQEHEAFYLLARLREAHQFIDSARDAYRRLLAVCPEHADAALQLARLEDHRSGRFVSRTAPAPGGHGLRHDSRSSFPASVPVAVPTADRHGSSAGVDSGPNTTGVPNAPLQAGGIGFYSGGGPDSATLDAHRRATGTIMMAGAPARANSHPPEVRRTMPPAAGGLPQPPLASGSAAPLLLPPGALTVGSMVADRYRLDAKLGQGGMATVFKALDTEIDEEIALKLFTQPVEDEGMLLRFRQELALSRQLSHPNIIRLYDIGSHFGMRFITMELLHGHELRADLRRGPLPFRRAVNLLLQACAGLASAHAHGVIHRDIKPENFFITNDGVLKLMDFGIAKRQSAPGVTVTGTMAGTPTYMSPEQISNFAAVTHATDLYALGVVAYEMFTGTVPFPGPEIMAILNGHLQTPPTPLHQRNPKVPPEAERVVLQLMAKQPAQRYADCNQLSEDLQRLRASLPADSE